MYFSAAQRSLSTERILSASMFFPFYKRDQHRRYSRVINIFLSKLSPQFPFLEKSANEYIDGQGNVNHQYINVMMREQPDESQSRCIKRVPDIAVKPCWFSIGMARCTFSQLAQTKKLPHVCLEKTNSRPATSQNFAQEPSIRTTVKAQRTMFCYLSTLQLPGLAESSEQRRHCKAGGRNA